MSPLPNHGRPAAEVIEDAEWLISFDTPLGEVARRVGMREESLRTLLARQGRRDLLAEVSRRKAMR